MDDSDEGLPPGEDMEVRYSDRPDHVRYVIRRAAPAEAFWPTVSFHGGMAARQMTGTPSGFVELTLDEVHADIDPLDFGLLFVLPGVMLIPETEAR